MTAETIRIYLNGQPGARPAAPARGLLRPVRRLRPAARRRRPPPAAQQGCTARSPPSATPAATPRSPASSAATASPSPAAPAGPGSRSRSPRTAPPAAVLPVRVAPLAGETIASYLARVAAACHLPLRAVTDVLPPWFAAQAAACDDIAKPGLLQPADARCLAMLTGITETALRHALPALAGHRDDGRPPLRATAACRRCAARHGQHEPVPVHLPAHQRACEGTAPGSAAPSRSTSPQHRTSSPPA